MRLPDKLSDLLELALGDLRKQEAAPNSVVDMGQWLECAATGTCFACLAGSVMRWSLGIIVPTGDATNPWYCGHDYHNTSRLLALNDLRCGEVAGALVGIGHALRDDLESLDRTVPSYEQRDEFYAAMNQLVTDLRAEGL